MTYGSLFSGIGGIDLGLDRAGLKCKWVENNKFCQGVLAKHWPRVKRYGDIQELDPRELEQVDLVAGGFPCQDISSASASQSGILGTRSGLWREFSRVLRVLRPKFVLVENVPVLRNRGLALVLQDFWALGYDAEWHCIPAGAFGAWHKRDRIWILAQASHVADADRQPVLRASEPWEECDAWAVEPGVGLMVYGVPFRVDRIQALGNSAVPQVVEWIGKRIKEYNKNESE